VGQSNSEPKIILLDIAGSTNFSPLALQIRTNPLHDRNQPNNAAVSVMYWTSSLIWLGLSLS
jgi:hypothetical protein